MVLFDIIVDEDGDARVELLAHGSCATITELGDKRQNNDICPEQTQRVESTDNTATETQGEMQEDCGQEHTSKQIEASLRSTQR